MAEPFQFELVSPERLLMSELVDQVVVPGTEGYFTVLKGHAPFMSTLRPGVIDMQSHRRRARMRVFVRGGFADVNANGLTILAEQAIPRRRHRPGAAGAGDEGRRGGRRRRQGRRHQRAAETRLAAAQGSPDGGRRRLNR